ncbi:MAG TPA: inorganic diphosphatase, partial [Pyrinomonadaceae bacterium]|nr:inorganic diphosphatase [Pyrinomonadaceae bacterium]
RMIDAVEADDKIVAVLHDDVAFGHIEDIAEVPAGLVDRLRHYFLTYKQLPQDAPRRVEITDVYGRDEALDVIRRSFDDYRTLFGAPEKRIEELRRLLKG